MTESWMDLKIVIEPITIRPGSYSRPRAYLVDDDNPLLNEETTEAIFWTSDTDVAYVFNSVDGYPIIVAKADGTCDVFGSLQLADETLIGSTNLTVATGYDLGLTNSLSFIPSRSEMFNSPFGKVSGYNKGRKRATYDAESSSSSDALQSTKPPAPALLLLSASKLFGSQNFDRQAYTLSTQTGYGRWYGWKYGTVGTVQIF